MVAVGALLVILFVSDALASCTKPASLFITAPKKMEALSGSCLQIPCSFNPKDKNDFTDTIQSFGVWIKNDPRFGDAPDNVIFNSSETTQTYPMELIGNLGKKNCTTIFSNLSPKHKDVYFFRLENQNFKATSSCDPINITVKDSAWSPRIKTSGVLKEKESVTITCSASTPCPHSPPELTWNLQQHSHRQIEENTDGTFTSKIQKTITLSDSHDGYNISCSVTYPVDGGKRVKSAQTEVTLSVSYAPKDTSASISPSGLVSAGSWVNLSCSSRAKPPVSSFTWFQSSKGGAVRVAEGHFYRLNVTEMTDTGSYYCVAANGYGNQTSSWNHLQDEGSFPLSTAVITGIIFIVLICLVIYAWRLKSKHPITHPTQTVALQEAAGTAENQDIHYGEIDFSVQRLPSDSVHNAKQLQNVVYSQVNMRRAEKSFNQTTSDDIYAQVKKK